MCCHYKAVKKRCFFVHLSNCLLFVLREHRNQSTPHLRTCLRCQSHSMHKSTKVGGVTTTMPDREAAQGVGSCWMPLVVREEPILGCDIIKQMLSVTLCLSSSLPGHVQLTKDGGELFIVHGAVVLEFFPPRTCTNNKRGGIVFEFFPPGTCTTNKRGGVVRIVHCARDSCGPLAPTAGRVCCIAVTVCSCHPGNLAPCRGTAPLAACLTHGSAVILLYLH